MSSLTIGSCIRAAAASSGGYFWKLEAECLLNPRRLLLFLSLCCCFSQRFVHSPLISSIVDFVCSSDQVAQELIFFHRFGVPCGPNCVPSFSSLGGCSSPSSGVCYQSPQIGCVFVTVNSANSVNILSFFLSGSALCESLHGASIFSNNDALLLMYQFICAVNFVICVVILLYFRARYFGVILVFIGGSCIELTLWDSGAEFWPLQARSSLLEDTFCSKFLTATTLFRIQFCVDF